MTKTRVYDLHEITSYAITGGLFPNTVKRDDSVKGVILRYDRTVYQGGRQVQIFTLNETLGEASVDDLNYRWRSALRYGPKAGLGEEIITVSVEDMPVIGRYMVVDVKADGTDKPMRAWDGLAPVGGVTIKR